MTAVAVSPRAGAPPLLAVTIDTEEDGLFSGRYPASGHTLENLRHLPDLIALLEAHGCPGTWLLTYPAALDARCRDSLKPLVHAERGEVGTHLHSWSCPPHDSVEDRLPRFPHCLPGTLQRRKLESLADAIAAGFAVRPRTYRAGRWGFGTSSLSPLLETGHRIDTSVVPGWWQKGDGAPSFIRAPRAPYHPDPGDILRPGPSPLLEIPVTTGFTRGKGAGPSWSPWVRPWLPGGRALLERAGFAVLRPALHGEAPLLRLVEGAIAEGRAVINMMLHSSEISPGHSPYCRDGAQRLAILKRTARVLERALTLGARPATLAGAAARLMPAA